MKGLLIPVILGVTILITGFFAFSPINQASTVHVTIQDTIAATVLSTASIEDTNWDIQADTAGDAAKRLTCTDQATISEIAFDIGGTVVAGTDIDLVVDIDGTADDDHEEITFTDIFGGNAPADELAILASLGLNQGIALDDNGIIELVLDADADNGNEDVNITAFFTTAGTCAFTSVAP